MRTRHAQPLVVLSGLVLLGGCSRREKHPPAPPTVASVTIQNVLGTCSDVAECERGCEAGSAERCRRLGATLERAKEPEADRVFAGRDSGKDEARATHLFERACAMGDAMGCVEAGRMYEFQHGVAKDDAKAAGFYEASCKHGYAVGCYNQAIMLETGRGVAKDPARAADLYDIACRQGAKSACEKAKGLRAPP